MKKKAVRAGLVLAVILFLIYFFIGTYRINKKYPNFVEEDYEIGDQISFGQNEDILITMTDIRFEDYLEEYKDSLEFEKVLLVDFELENKSDKTLGFTPIIFSIRNERGYVNGVDYSMSLEYTREEEWAKLRKQQIGGNTKAYVTLPFNTGYLESKELTAEELDNYYIVVCQYPKYQKIYLGR